MTQNLTSTHATAAAFFQVQYLEKKDIAEALSLIASIKNSGHLSKPYHLKDRDADELHQLLADGYPLLGVKTPKGQLIAFATVSKTHAESDMLIIRSLCIDPACKGLGLGTKLVSTATQWMMDNGNGQLHAKVASDNHASLTLFGKAGFTPQTVDWDSNDNYWYYMMELSPFAKPAPTPSFAFQQN